MLLSVQHGVSQLYATEVAAPAALCTCSEKLLTADFGTCLLSPARCIGSNCVSRECWRSLNPNTSRL